MMDTTTLDELAGAVPVGARDCAHKASGAFAFLTDREFAGCLWAAYVRSPYPRATAISVDTDALRAAEGVEAVFTWADVPDARFNPALLPPHATHDASRDKRMLTRTVRHIGDEIAVVIARTQVQARRAAAQARVEWVTEPAVLTIDEAVRSRVVARMGAGPEAAPAMVAASALRLRRRFDFAAASHVCMEAPACVAQPSGSGVEVWTNTQCPLEVRRQIAVILRLDPEVVRVRKVDEGGGFGAKQDLYAEPMAAWLALRLGRPVRFSGNRADELRAGRVRAGGRIDLAIGFDPDGRLVASHTRAVLDSGGYASHTPFVLGCLIGHQLAVYPRGAHRLDGMVVATDTIPAGAYRGYGVAESNFAVEQMIDEAAGRLDLSPAEIRRRNLFSDRTGRSASACLDALPEAPVPPGDGEVRRGRGIAIAAKHSVGGDGTDSSRAEVRLVSGPRLILTTGTCDSGTGSSRALAGIVAGVLGAPLDAVLVREGDTARGTDLGSTAQRSVYVGGVAARKAAENCRAAILAAAGRTDLELRWPDLTDPCGRGVTTLDDLAAAADGGIAGRATGTATGRGASYCALAVDVAVDTATGWVRVERADMIIDCGQVVDALGARGQAVGGLVQGIGLACTDEWAAGHDGGGPESILDHGAPRAGDAPEMTVTFLAGDEPASGLGELPIVPVAAAVGNAIADATGVRVRRTPFRPATVWRRLVESERP